MSNQRINWLDVASYMVKTGNNSLRCAPISNVMSVEYNAKQGTKITMGISPDNITSEFAKGKLQGAFIYFDQDEFNKAKLELQNKDLYI